MITFPLIDFEWHKDFKILVAKDFDRMFTRHASQIWESGSGKAFFIAGHRSTKLFLRDERKNEQWKKIYDIYPKALDIYAYYDEHNQFLAFFIKNLRSNS